MRIQGNDISHPGMTPLSHSDWLSLRDSDTPRGRARKGISRGRKSDAVLKTQQLGARDAGKKKKKGRECWECKNGLKPRLTAKRKSGEGFSKQGSQRKKGEAERKIAEWRCELVKPRKACRIELRQEEPPSEPTKEESWGARRKRTITRCTSAVISLGGLA